MTTRRGFIAGAAALLAATDANAMFRVNQLHGFGAGSANRPLFDILASLGLTTDLQFCLDAGDSLSYSSGQPWLDRSTNGYDFNRGADATPSTDDPTFNGSPGGLSRNEYFEVDGGDHFEYDSGGSETAFESLHKDNAKFAWLAGIFIPSGMAATARLFTTDVQATDRGLRLNISSALKNNIIARNGTLSSIDKTADTALGDNAWHIVGGSIDEATGAGGGFFYADGAYDQVSSSDTFDATYASPSISNTGWAAIGARGDGAQNQSPNGFRLAFHVLWQGGTVITKVNFDDIFAQARGRFGI